MTHLWDVLLILAVWILVSIMILLTWDHVKRHDD